MIMSKADNPHNEGDYIYHSVTKFDTLPGVAIKYGVEVAEIKKMNSLATDRHMFALHSLRIPLPGRHPTSYTPRNNLQHLYGLKHDGTVNRSYHHWLSSEHDYELETPEKVFIEESVDTSIHRFSSITANGLALRPKNASRGSQGLDESDRSSSSTGSGHFPKGYTPGKVLKFYSYFNKSRQDESSFSSFWSNTMCIFPCKFKAAQD